MKRLVNVTLFISICLFSLQVTSDEKTNLVVEYLELSKTKEVFDETITTYVDQISTANPNTDKEILRNYFESYMGWEILKEPTIEKISSILSIEELKAINSFYKTEHGASYANKSPALSSAVSEIIGQNLNKVMATLQGQ
ncbi:MAG: DUF2059 domain-containing protein [Candidatus Thiodiazotropha taylori]|nr:DUF2059 domain-containing protein [Candidatus Thiodiazotropha taylori]